MNADNTDLGPYRLLQCLGEGGAGRVFKARHQLMNRTVAVKVIHKELLADAETVGRFYREIQIVSQLNHPNIVHAFDGGPVGGVHLLVMEYAAGVDLDQLVSKSGPLAVPKACELVRQAALGLQHIHERGLVHRDIKPSNLILCKLRPGESGLGTVKILDLGLGRLHEGVHGKTTTRLADGKSVTTLTMSGSTMGTVDYMAPEQALDFHRADIRADIYSLGCALFYLLTGKPPFEGTMAVKLMRHQQAEPPDLTQRCPQAPPALAEVVRRMLAKRPDARYQTPGEVAAALDSLLGPSAPPAASNSRTTAVPRRTGPKSRAKLLALVGAGVVAAALGLGLLAALPAKPEPVAAVASPTRPSPATLPATIASPPTKATESAPEKLPPEQPSPLDRLDPKTIPAGTKAPKQLAAVFGEDGPMLLSVAFSSDGKLLAAGGSDGFLHVWDAGTGKTADAPPRGMTGSGIHALAIAPGGASYALVGNDRRAKIRDWQSNSLQGTIDPQDRSARSQLQFTSDGKLLAALIDKKAVKVWDVALQQLRHALAVSGEVPLCAAFAPDGRTLAVGCSSGVKFFDVASGTMQGSLDLPAGVHAAAYSPDGKKLAVDGSGFIRIYSLASREETQAMTTGSGESFHPAVLQFSRDGARIACLMERGKVLCWDLPSGTPILQWQGSATDITFAPDSRHLATAQSNGRAYLFRLGNSSR